MIPQTKKAIQQKVNKIKKTIDAEAAEKAPEIPKDLEDLWAAVIAISTTYKMLQEGMFPFRFNNAVGVSLKFLEQLHEKTFADCAKHGSAHLIPELQQLIETNKQNGKTTAKTTKQ